MTTDGTDHGISAVALIAKPLYEFPPPEPSPSGQRLTVPIPNAGASTLAWSNGMLKGTRLAAKAWLWDTEAQYQVFLDRLKRRGIVQACTPPPFIDLPESEADVMSALDLQLVSVVHRVTDKWLPSPTLSPKTRGQSWISVVVSEAYAKASRDQNDGNVRVDELVSVKAKWDVKHPETRSTAASRKIVQDANIRSTHRYIPRDNIWGIHEAASDLGYKKGLVAIEVKKFGLLNLNPTDMASLAEKGENIAVSRTESPNCAGMRGILQQAIRYTYHYGTQFAYITDYQTGILLRVPDLDASVTKDEKKNTMTYKNVTIDWAVVDIKQARTALAFLVSCACDAMEQTPRAHPNLKGPGMV